MLAPATMYFGFLELIMILGSSGRSVSLILTLTCWATQHEQKNKPGMSRFFFMADARVNGARAPNARQPQSP